jgi:2-dehydro-3-deoxyglucarate aldolase/4-hydroxy-2-oxoheptanedioate aldolase
VANNFKERLKNGEVLLGPLVTLASPEVAEIMAMVGFDYVWIETEHATTNFAQAQLMIQAVGGRCPCLVRIPENQEVWFKKALDTGCDGIVIPQVKSAAEARAAVEYCLYPPAGRRSVGVSRAHGYGMSFQDYVSRINEELVIVLQVEHIEGVRNVEAIARTPGIDAILVGPFDLSGSMNRLGQISQPEVQEAIETVRRHCQQAGLPVGIFATDTEFARQAIQTGFNLIALGMDTFYLWQSARSALRQVRGG